MLLRWLRPLVDSLLLGSGDILCVEKFDVFTIWLWFREVKREKDLGTEKLRLLQA